jgi:hypothetical protein
MFTFRPVATHAPSSGTASFLLLHAPRAERANFHERSLHAAPRLHDGQIEEATGQATDSFLAITASSYHHPVLQARP